LRVLAAKGISRVRCIGWRPAHSSKRTVVERLGRGAATAIEAQARAAKKAAVVFMAMMSGVRSGSARTEGRDESG
jgi:hypothetical protein